MMLGIAVRLGCSSITSMLRYSLEERSHAAGSLLRQRSPYFSITCRSAATSGMWGVLRGEHVMVVAAWPKCRKCGEGELIPLSDYGTEGAAVTYKAWVCTNP